MATGTSNNAYGIATYADISSKTGFTVSTTNKNSGKCPTKSEILSCVSSGYTANIPSSYSSNQLVAFKDISASKKSGSLIISLNYSPIIQLNDFTMGVYYGNSVPSNISSLERMNSISNAAVRSVDSSNYTISIDGSALGAITSNTYIIYCWDGFEEGYGIAYAWVTTSQLNTVKNGTNVTVSGYSSVLSYY